MTQALSPAFRFYFFGGEGLFLFILNLDTNYYIYFNQKQTKGADMQVKYVQIFKGTEEKTFSTLKECANFLGCYHQKLYVYNDSDEKLNGWSVKITANNTCEVCGKPLTNYKDDVCSNRCYSIWVTGREPKYLELGEVGEVEAMPKVRSY